MKIISALNLATPGINRMKSFCEIISKQMGLNGEITDAVLSEARWQLENPKRKIEVSLRADRDPDNQDTPYSAIVFQWSWGPTYIYNSNTEQQEIMPGTENGGWHNTGVVCWGKTPEDAFTQALEGSKRLKAPKFE